MDAKFASTNSLQISQSEAFLSLGLFDKTILQIVPKNGLLICTSSLQVLQVLGCYLQVNVQLLLLIKFKSQVSI